MNRNFSSGKNYSDLWAFGFYAIFTLVNATRNFYVMNFTNFKYLSQELTKSNLIGLISITSILFILLIFMIYFLPRFSIHLGFIVIIASKTYLIINSASENIEISFVQAIFVMIILGFYLTVILKYINIIGLFLKVSCVIFLRNIIRMTFYIILLTIFNWLVLLLTITPTRSCNKIIYYMQLGLTELIIIYSLNVIVCTVIFAFVGRSETNFLLPLKNVIRSSGAICLGALVIPVLQLIRFVLPEENGSRVSLSRIFKTSLKNLDDLVLNVNWWIFVHVTINKERLFSAIKSSGQKLRSSAESMYNIYTMDAVLMFLGIYLIRLVYYSDIITIILQKLSFIDSSIKLNVETCRKFGLSFVVCFFSAISACNKVLCYLCQEYPNNVRQHLESFYKNYEKIKNYN